MAYEVKAGEIAIVIRPHMEMDDTWSGKLQTGLIFGGEGNDILHGDKLLVAGSFPGDIRM